VWCRFATFLAFAFLLLPFALERSDMTDPIDLAWLVPFFPLAGVILNGFLGPRLGKGFVKWVGPLVVLAAFFVSLWIFFHVLGSPADGRSSERVLWQWINSGVFQAPVALRIDPLSVTMMLVVTGVGFLIHVYSAGYMADDPRFARYFAWLNLFTFAMLILVMANNYLLMFVGWEGVGLCSFLLIGFFFEKESAAAAGKKAFLVNRVGDWGFLLGLLLMFWTFRSVAGDQFRTLNFTDVFHNAAQVAQSQPEVVAVIALLLFVGATGKSAQLPLYLWLPDAMEGPTPVSALIHAATMVTAGVYMIARSHELFSAAPMALNVVAWVGVITALFAAIVAVVQNDIKRVLAYSTVSQLGYMFVGVGVAAYSAGIFHLVTHAFFKALLFLGAGSVMHALAGELDIRKMGGLRKHLPWTFGTMLLAWLAIAGIPPFAGFYSKDVILESAYQHGQMGIWLIGLATAGLTAFYMSRMFFTVFFGQERYVPAAEGHGHGGHDHAHGGHGHGHGIHESPPVMTVPLMVLAVLSVIGGLWLNWGVLPHPGGLLASFLAPSVGPMAEHGAEAAHSGLSPVILMVISVAVAAAGILVALFMHNNGAFVRERPTALRRLVENRFGYDALLHGLVVVGGTQLAIALWRFVEIGIIDRIVNGVGAAVAGAGQALRVPQTGFVRNYALSMLVGTVAVLGIFFYFMGR
jgi:NADH-quinone oxidoreductase subunit L